MADTGVPEKGHFPDAAIHGAPPDSGPSTVALDPTRDLGAALHEVSNALTVVLGWIERARGESDGLVDIAHALDIATARAQQARGIIRRAIGAEVPVDPAALVEVLLADVVTGLDPEFRRAGVGAAMVVAPPVARLPVEHPSIVLQILTNLVLNAIAVSPPRSTVRIHAALAGDSVAFSVADQGPGVEPSRRRTLFHAARSTRPGGAGIGLRHAAALARSLGGDLSLVDVSAGACFQLVWPTTLGSSDRIVVSERVPLSTPRSARGGVSLEGARILLVEDDSAVVDLLDTALTARGADVVSVRHSKDLEGALATGRFHAALFDLSPIQDDVRGAVERARTSSGALRVVLISGSATQMPPLPEAWVAAWIRKPFEIGEIVQALTSSTTPPTSTE